MPEYDPGKNDVEIEREKYKITLSGDRWEDAKLGIVTEGDWDIVSFATDGPFMYITFGDDSGEPVGFLEMVMKENTTFLWHMRVVPERRREMLGSFMFDIFMSYSIFRRKGASGHIGGDEKTREFLLSKGVKEENIKSASGGVRFSVKPGDIIDG